MLGIIKHKGTPVVRKITKSRHFSNIIQFFLDMFRTFFTNVLRKPYGKLKLPNVGYQILNYQILNQNQKLQNQKSPNLGQRHPRKYF